MLAHRRLFHLHSTGVRFLDLGQLELELGFLLSESLLDKLERAARVQATPSVTLVTAELILLP